MATSALASKAGPENTKAWSVCLCAIAHINRTVCGRLD